MILARRSWGCCRRVDSGCTNPLRFHPSGPLSRVKSIARAKVINHIFLFEISAGRLSPGLGDDLSESPARGVEAAGFPADMRGQTVSGSARNVPCENIVQQLSPPYLDLIKARNRVNSITAPGRTKCRENKTRPIEAYRKTRGLTSNEQHSGSGDLGSVNWCPLSLSCFSGGKHRAVVCFLTPGNHVTTSTHIPYPADIRGFNLLPVGWVDAYF